MKKDLGKKFTLAQWINIFKKGSKFYYLSDLMKLSGLSYSAARKAAQRLVKKGILIRIYTEYFGNSLCSYQAEEVANRVYPPSYVSCETALFHHGVIDQAPFAIVSVSTRKGKRIRIGENRFIYHKILRSLFWGYVSDKGYLLAEPEKALLDWFYLKSRKNIKPPLDEINWVQLDLKKLKKYSKHYPKNIQLRLLNYFS